MTLSLKLTAKYVDSFSQNGFYQWVQTREISQILSYFVSCTIQYHTVLIHTVRWWAHVMRESVVTLHIEQLMRQEQWLLTVFNYTMFLSCTSCLYTLWWWLIKQTVEEHDDVMVMELVMLSWLTLFYCYTIGWRYSTWSIARRYTDYQDIVDLLERVGQYMIT